MEFDPKLFSLAALYLASKLEECALHQGQAEVLIHTMRVLDKTFPYSVEDLLSAEFYLLEELEFDLIVFHPYQSVMEYLTDAKLESLVEITWSVGILLRNI